jgi:Family of unknown function (DUF6493)
MTAAESPRAAETLRATDLLRAATDADDEAAIRAFMADLPEADRADLVPVAREITAAEKKKGFGAGSHLKAMLLIAYGVLPVSEIRKLGWRSNHLPAQLEVVLRRRAPARLVPIVEFLLDDVTDWAWRVVRPLVRQGFVPRPDRPSYTIAMLAATRRRAAADLVADDPELLAVEAWRLFEVEGGGEDSLANHEKFFGDTWGDLFRDLATRDPAIRDRLLDASVAALARDFATYRAGWYSRFHETLAPTDDERARRSDAYLGLLRSRVGPTVSFAVAALASVDHAGRLSPDDLLDRIGPVLAEGGAGTANAALGLVGRAGARSAEDARRAAVVAADALANASPDVQRAAVALIGGLVRETDAAVARAVADRLAGVAASQRSAVAELIARLGGAGAAPPPQRPGAGVPAPSALAAPMAIDPDRAIEPLSSIEALVDVAVSVLESGEPADDVERVMDAVGRLGAERPATFSRLTAAIARRARTILARRESVPFNGFDARADVAAVLLAWAAGELVEPTAGHRSVHPGGGAFLSARARDLAEAVAAGRAFVGVAAPTHRGGWIDPAVLVDRLEGGQPASTIDLVAAVLRLAPDGRAAALDAATGLGGEAGAVVRYALGGHEAIGPTAAWWVAAARVRAPGEDDPAVETRHPGLGPGAGRAARVRLTVRDPKRSYGGFGLEIEPPLGDATGIDLPTVLMLRTMSSFSWTGRSEPAMLRWMATIQPGDRETWAATGSLPIARNIDWWSAEWANRAYLEPFVDAVTPIGPHGRALVGIALGAKEAGERGLATDVATLALGDGRLTASTLAEGLRAAAAISCDRPNRWALSLADVAAPSDDHAAAVADAIGRTLPALAGRPPAKLVPLLRLLDELTAGTGAPAPTDARPVLEDIGAAGGQAGRLARSVLARG